MSLQHDKKTIDAFLEKWKIARALEMAECGALDKAESLLMNKGLGPKTLEEYDLLARIHVLQGRYVKAKQMWSYALTCEPDNEIYRKALDTLGVYLDDLATRRKAFFLAINFGLIALVIIALMYLIK
ncbi:MAG: hypothetical protein NTZ94_02215 [Verrucomicrobia bacterium]|nr:hypothetical protein [Verrucomicrobiota bacterium]